MNILTVTVGGMIFLYGVYTAWVRLSHPERLFKLSTMREAFGSQAGGVIHFTTYTLAPLLIGLVIIWAGKSGMSLLG